MKIVFVVDQVFRHGGIERVLSIKANFFSENSQHDVSIITTEQNGKVPCYHFSSKINFIDIGINYNRSKSYFHPENLLKLPKHIAKIKSELKRINPDVVVVCSHSTDTYFMPFIVRRIPKIKEFHFSKFIEIEARKNPKNAIKKYFFKFSDYVEGKYNRLVALNKDEKNYYKTNNVEVIPNPLTFYPKTVSNLSSNIGITAGRIAPVKGYDELIDIWSLIHKENANWQLHIYGEGEKQYVGTLQQKIKDKKLEDVIFIKGPTNNIQEKMLGASLFVMSSHNECFPLVLLEAQACGLPIVSYNCPHGPANIITKNSGILVPMHNKKSFANNLLTLIKDKSKRNIMGASARDNANQYTVEKIMELWQEMFNGVTKELS